MSLIEIIKLDASYSVVTTYAHVLPLTGPLNFLPVYSESKAIGLVFENFVVFQGQKRVKDQEYLIFDFFLLKVGDNFLSYFIHKYEEDLSS